MPSVVGNEQSQAYRHHLSCKRSLNSSNVSHLVECEDLLGADLWVFLVLGALCDLNTGGGTCNAHRLPIKSRALPLRTIYTATLAASRPYTAETAHDNSAMIKHWSLNKAPDLRCTFIEAPNRWFLHISKCLPEAAPVMVTGTRASATTAVWRGAMGSMMRLLMVQILSHSCRYSTSQTSRHS